MRRERCGESVGQVLRDRGHRMGVRGAHTRFLLFGLLVFGLLATSLLGPGSAPAQEAVPDEWQTVAERSGYEATSTSAEVEEFVRNAGASSDLVHVMEFGRTVEDRPMLAAVVADPPVTSPGDLADDPRLVALLLGNIHSGECAGKEALLAMLRDLVLNGDSANVLDHVVVVFVPNYNVDGNDRRGPRHRPGQVGPDVMGRRENAQDLDLNREFVKLDSPEARSLVELINAWDPHLIIDTHTTNGSRHRYVLTYDVPHNPASSTHVRNFLRNEMMPVVTERLEEAGVPTFYYGNFNREHTRWTTYGHEPRYSTEYLGLRNRLGILSEAYSYASYEDRVKATEAFVRACLRFIAENRDAVRQAIEDADAETVQTGNNPSAADPVPVQARLEPFPDPVTVRGFERQGRDQTPVPRDYEVEFVSNYVADQTVTPVYAYLIPHDQSRVADRLRMHGIELHRLSQEKELLVEVYEAESLERASRPFQGHHLVTAEVSVREETRNVAAGTYVVRTGQPLGTLATYLLEPASDDGLVTWNFFDPGWEVGQEYPILRLTRPIRLLLEPVERVEPAQLLDLDQIYGPRGRVNFSGSGFSVPRWLPDSETYVRQIGRRTVQVDAATGAAEPYAEEDRGIAEAFAALPEISMEDAQRMAGGNLIRSDDRQAVLARFASDLFYFRFGEERAIRLTHSPDPERLPTFSPDGQLVAFVRENNLYVVDVTGGHERPLTTDGNPLLLNGYLDWVYQEEVYGRGNFRGFWWSPDSKRLAFLQIDEEPVHNYTVTDHVPVRQSLEVTPYPKSGDPLPQVRLGIVRAAGGDVRWLEEEGSAREQLIVRVSWSPDGEQVVYQIQDRPQTWLELRRAPASGGSPSTVIREESEAWVNVLGQPHWLEDGSFLWLSERTGYAHLYHVSADGSSTRPLTHGEWQVHSLLGVDPDEAWVYFTASRDSNTATHGYRVPLAGGEVQRITQEGYSHSLRFNDTFTYFFDLASNMRTPIKTFLHRADGSYVRTINPNLTDLLDYYDIQQPEFHQVPARDGFMMDAVLIKPPDFDPEKKYPVLVYVYSGPQAPVVRDRWGGSTYLWHQMLAQRGYCIWMCDNRSATQRGVRHAWPIHRRMGENELRDIEDGLAWLKQHPWIDGDRIGIWGWSYGGYMTAYAMTHSDLFRAGISGAPVTDWKNYDAIYTERYMHLPQDNPEGYRTSSVLDGAANLHGNLLLIHGTQDDNVHMSNTLQLVLELQQAGHPFQLMLYPKNRHGIARPDQARHLRDMMTAFLLDNL